MRVMVFFVVLVFLSVGVFAVSGVVPNSYSVDFSSNLEREFVFDFVVGDVANLYVDGEMAEHVRLDKDRIVGREKVVVFLSLPSEIDSFGVNQIFVCAGEGRNFCGVVKVFVPYPERYVGVEVSAPNVNFGEVVEGDVKFVNLGRSVVGVGSRLEIFFDGEIVDSFDFGSEIIGVSEFLSYDFSFDSSNYSAGDYVAVGVVDYGDGISRDEDVFRVGEFRVGLLNYSDEFVEGEVGRFEVEVENLWNNKMSEVYAELKVGGLSFDSSIVELKPWEKRTLVGSFDGSEFVEGEFGGKIVLHYDGGVVSEDVVLRIVEGDFDYVFWGGVFLFFVFIVGLVWFLFFRE